MNEKSFFKKIQNLFINPDNSIFVYLIAVFIIAYFTYFNNYTYPPYQFWDENYHIASAQKYIDGVMFMEPHPPLGKMFIALGEMIFQPNKTVDKDYFSQTDYINYFPENYSFKGVRFFSAFFALFSSFLFFGILYQIFKKPFLSFLLTSLYLFDNALILHSRAAMLEGIQIFFILGAIFYFIYIIQSKNSFVKFNYFILGLLSGLAIAVKINSGILMLLPVFLFVYELDSSIENKIKIKFKKLLNSFITKILSFLFAASLILGIVFYIHFALGNKLSNNSYNASPEYLKILKEKDNKNIFNFYIMLRDNLQYMKNYQNGVPKLDKSKPDENGSYPVEWPIGSKTIDYRWNKLDNDKISYLYLIGNPIIWLSGLIGLILSFTLAAGKIFFNLEIKNKKNFFHILTFLMLYFGYMISVMQIERVLYLYHYFIPLIFSLFLFALVFYYIFETELIKNDIIVYCALTIFCLVIVSVFLYYSPFTYFKPISTREFLNRAWFDYWGLQHVN